MIEEPMTADDFTQHIYGVLSEYLDGLYEARERISLLEDFGDFQVYGYAGSVYEVEIKVTKK